MKISNTASEPQVGTGGVQRGHVLAGALNLHPSSGEKLHPSPSEAEITPPHKNSHFWVVLRNFIFLVLESGQDQVCARTTSIYVFQRKKSTPAIQWWFCILKPKPLGFLDTKPPLSGWSALFFSERRNRGSSCAHLIFSTTIHFCQHAEVEENHLKNPCSNTSSLFRSTSIHQPINCF